MFFFFLVTNLTSLPSVCVLQLLSLKITVLTMQENLGHRFKKKYNKVCVSECTANSTSGSLCEHNPHHFSYKGRLLPGTPAGPPELCLPAGLHFHWSRHHGGSCRYKFSASPQYERSWSAHKTHQSSTRWGSHDDPEHFPVGSYCLQGK